MRFETLLSALRLPRAHIRRILIEPFRSNNNSLSQGCLNLLGPNLHEPKLLEPNVIEVPCATIPRALLEPKRTHDRSARAVATACLHASVLKQAIVIVGYDGLAAVSTACGNAESPKFRWHDSGGNRLRQRKIFRIFGRVTPSYNYLYSLANLVRAAVIYPFVT